MTDPDSCRQPTRLINVTTSTRAECGIALERSVALSYVRLLIDYCQQHGLFPADLLARAEVCAELDLANEDARMGFRDFMRLCDAAEQALGDESLALKLGEAIRPGHYGIHGHSVMSARTLGECLDRSLRFHSLVHNAGRNVLKHEGELAVMCYECNLPGCNDLGRFQNALCLSAWTSFARWITGFSDHTPEWVSFTHAQPACTQAYAALFRCPLYFSATRNAIAFPSSYLSLPNPQANPTVLRIMDALSERSLLLYQTPGEAQWLVDARQYIAESLQYGAPTLQGVAAALEMPALLLQKTMKKQGIQLGELIDETRKTLVMSYMQDPALSLIDISFLLGFSEQSAFTRAFKRWTGESPRSYRRARS